MTRRSARAPSEIGTVIVGGGIVGMCLAWFLAEEGHDVAVVDDGRHAGTIANAGGLHVQLQSRFMRLYPEMVPAFEETLPFYPRAVRHWQALAARLGEDIELAVTGGLMVAESSEQYAFLEKKCRREQQLGLEVEMLDRAALDRIAPYFAGSIVGAELCATEGKVNPLLANQAIRRKALAAGVVHCTETRVTRPRARRRTASRSRPAAARSAPAASSSPPAPGPARWPTISASKCRRAPSRCT